MSFVTDSFYFRKPPLCLRNFAQPWPRGLNFLVVVWVKILEFLLIHKGGGGGVGEPPDLLISFLVNWSSQKYTVLFLFPAENLTQFHSKV